ncbi:hypothetical protein TSOC_012039 [Tetrabaena socialis]|uniref:Uncharacterized protein n=1 Tax=Tetrabaena socialis TaxID=47790 RepID=A0A2J7ZP51_9CHLO|nr:hypothetical protein TSOC_012039 [Tetrabaena socialis]|eukprot:PNH02049.1 hypothetical protein TSOC_012039 [Tetrabaena socialis]
MASSCPGAGRAAPRQHGAVPQLQDALATAIAAVLVNASTAAATVARALPPLPPVDGGLGSAAEPAGHRSAHPPRPEEPAADGAGQLAVAAVLWNAQCHAAALRAAGGEGAVQRADKRWTREQVEDSQHAMLSCSQILVDHLRALPSNAGGGSLAVKDAMTTLGLDGLPEPDRRLLAKRAARKLSKLRTLLGQGADPFEDRRPRVKKNTHQWRAWLRQAFMELPDRTGTLQDAAAIIEADPSIAPLLDRTCPEFESTGQKRGRSMLFRYNEEAAEEWTARKAKVPKRGVQSLPYLGKES